MTNTQKTTYFAAFSAVLTALIESEILGKYKPVAVGLQSLAFALWGYYSKGTEPGEVKS